MCPVVRNIQNDDLYIFLGGNKFRNMRTSNEGTVDDDTARKIFKVNVEMTQIFFEYPLVEEFIKRMNLKFLSKPAEDVNLNRSAAG